MNASTHSSCSVRRLVIDTQAILDWQFFRNPACASWPGLLVAGNWQWIATAAMRDELAHVLSRLCVPAEPRAWPGAAEAVLAHFDHHVSLQPAPTLPLTTPRCSDRDDQKFIDLAIATGAHLISRDKAVLKLRRRAAPLGAHILSPADWPPAAP